MCVLPGRSMTGSRNKLRYSKTEQVNGKQPCPLRPAITNIASWPMANGWTIRSPPVMRQILTAVRMPFCTWVAVAALRSRLYENCGRRDRRGRSIKGSD